MNTESFRLHSARLRVADLAQARAFYGGVLGLALDHAGAPVQLREVSGILPKPEGMPGLFHLALRVPDRPSLARVLRRLDEQRVPLQGLSDHGVSEAIYLADPEGNGLEIYADRPRASWHDPAGQLVLSTAALDVDALLATAPDARAEGLPAATVLGHIHLSVDSLAAAREFYPGTLGLGLSTEAYPGALFFGADGYHHHLAVNTWGRARPRNSSALPMNPSAAASQARPVFAGLESINASSRTVTAETVLINPDGVRIQLSPLTA